VQDREHDVDRAEALHRLAGIDDHHFGLGGVAAQRDLSAGHHLRQGAVSDSQSVHRTVGQNPLPAAGDPDRYDVVPRRVQRREHTPSGYRGDAVLAAAPAEDDRDPDPLGHGHSLFIDRLISKRTISSGDPPR
jgi:hypothetical protein